MLMSWPFVSRSMNASRTRLNYSAHVPWISTSGWCCASIAGSAAGCSSVLASRSLAAKGTEGVQPHRSWLFLSGIGHAHCGAYDGIRDKRFSEGEPDRGWVRRVSGEPAVRHRQWRRIRGAYRAGSSMSLKVRSRLLLHFGHCWAPRRSAAAGSTHSAP
jgi:hypothetical protein